MMTFALQHLQDITAGVFVTRTAENTKLMMLICFGCATGGAE